MLFPNVPGDDTLCVQFVFSEEPFNASGGASLNTCTAIGFVVPEEIPVVRLESLDHVDATATEPNSRIVDGRGDALAIRTSRLSRCPILRQTQLVATLPVAISLEIRVEMFSQELHWLSTDGFMASQDASSACPPCSLQRNS